MSAWQWEGQLVIRKSTEDVGCGYAAVEFDTEAEATAAVRSRLGRRISDLDNDPQLIPLGMRPPWADDETRVTDGFVYRFDATTGVADDTSRKDIA